jgi:prophage regulatory protein
MSSTATKRFLRRPELLRKTGLSATTVYNLERQGKFPQHFMLTPRCAVWDEQAVEKWMSERAKVPAACARVPEPRRRAAEAA